MSIDLPDRRRYKRSHIESIRFPFLATRSAFHACTQYLIMDISSHGLQIAIPKWLVNRERLQENELVNLHVPFKLAPGTFTQGRVIWSRWDDTLQSQLYGLAMTGKVPLSFPLYIDLSKGIDIGVDPHHFDSSQKLFFKLLKDIILLKRGILIYLKHLVPYFSRITSLSAAQFPQLKNLLLDDIKEKVEINQVKLEKMAEEANRKKGIDHLGQHLDLEQLRKAIESEVQYEVLKTALNTDAVMPYLKAIKELEKKLYYNYNAIVMLYIRSF